MHRLGAVASTKAMGVFGCVSETMRGNGGYCARDGGAALESDVRAITRCGRGALGQASS